MGDSEYPNLGLNPVPGMPDAVESLHGKVNSAVDSMSQANDLLGRLRNANDSVWQGDAGNAFREHFNTKLADELDHAHQSLGKAVNVIHGWHTDLVNFKDTAKQLDAAARKEQQQADTALQQAQSRLDAANSALRTATGKADGAAGGLDEIIKRAKELQVHHEGVARKAAAALKDATEHLAPHKPGLLSRIAHGFVSALKSVGDWVKDHLKDIHAVLSTIAAIGGLVALVIPPPVDAIALGVAAVAGAGALATDIADPQFRHGMGQLLTGHFNKESMGALMTGVGDVASVIPGVGVAKGALKGGEVTLDGIKGLASATAKQPGLLMQGLSRVPKLDVGGKIGGFADQILSKGFKDAEDIQREFGAVNRLDLLWRTRGAATSVYHDVKQAGS